MRLNKIFISASALSIFLISCGGQPAPEESTVTHPLNDTGITSCIDSENNLSCPSNLAPNQDAEFGRDAESDIKIGGGNAGFDFTKLDSHGAPLAIQDRTWELNGNETDGTKWSCIQDNVTGLIWEVKESDPTSERYRLHNFSWYNPVSTENGGMSGSGNLGTCPLNRCDTLAYEFFANETQLCGLNNWRIPNINELLSIVDQSQVNPAVDELYFPNTEPNAHWTNRTVAQNPGAAWYVYFTAGGNGNISKDGLAHIRLVSGEQ